MYLKLLKNDIKNNILQTVSIALFIILSSSFLSSSVQLALQLASSINELFERAKTPHILQMHTGDIDIKRMNDFVSKNHEIKEFQILDFLNIDNSILSFNDNPLKDSIYDNGFSVQSEKFDFLLDMSDNIIDVKVGEVYVPIFYYTSGMADVGDTLKIKDHSLKVAGFVRDSQMNSSLSLSKRFLINKFDYEKIRNLGSLEHLIEFRLNDIDKIAQIQSAYSYATLESNGPITMTFSLFKMVNAFSDGITALALAFISLLIILISMLCIRLTLLAKLEEDYKELSVLKAIGIAHKDIKRMFLCKYVFISGLSCILGFLLSFLIKLPFLTNMKMFFGEVSPNFTTYISGFSASFLVFIIVYLSMGKISKKLKSLNISGKFASEEGSKINLCHLPQKLFLAMNDMLCRKKIYFTMTVITVLSVFVLMMPMSIYTTLSDKSFVNYMGIGSYDVRIDISQIKGNEDKINELKNMIREDEMIEKYDVIQSHLLDFKSESGNMEKIWTDFSSQRVFPIKYIFGKAPLNDNEISLSKMKSDDMNKKVGDFVTLITDEGEKNVRVSGIFSDITNGGKTAKASFSISNDNAIWMIVPVQIKDGFEVKDFIKKYQSLFEFAKFADTKLYVSQIFGNTISMVYNTTIVAFISSLFLIFLITVLFVRMLFLKDIGENALLRSLGFTSNDIRVQYLIKSSLILILGLIAGNVFSLTFGDKFASVLLGFIGISNVQFIREPIFSYVLIPLCMVVFTMLATYLGASGIKDMNISEVLKEDV